MEAAEPGTGAEGSPSSPLGVLVALAVVTVATWWGAAHTSGALRIVLLVVLVAAGGYLALLLLSALVLVLTRRWLDRLENPRWETRRDRVPVAVRVLVVLLVGSWALTGWWSGHDRAEWGWSGLSVALAVVAVLLVTVVRRRRAAVPDGPAGPRHRRER